MDFFLSWSSVHSAVTCAPVEGSSVCASKTLPTITDRPACRVAEGHFALITVAGAGVETTMEMLWPGRIVCGRVTTDKPTESSSACRISKLRSPGGILSMRNRPAESVKVWRSVPRTEMTALRRYPPRMLSSATPEIVASSDRDGVACARTSDNAALRAHAVPTTMLKHLN